MLSRRIYDAQTAWNCLHGVINVYKPAGIKIANVRNAIITNLCKDLNALEGRPLRQRLCIEPGGAQNYIIRKTMNLADHVLSVGPRYQNKDIKCGAVSNMGIHTSGVLLIGINKGLSYTTKIHINRPIRVYHVTGRFGVAKENHFDDSRVTTKATYRHITSEYLSSLVASLQASHQRKMFELCGVDMQSQAAYELASKGTIRPASNKEPLIYNIKVISLRSPYFVLEIHAINEDENYLATLIHEIGIEMRSVAFCNSIRCIRHGHFSVKDSLLRRHWTLNEIFANMEICHKILLDHPSLIHQKTVELSPD